MAPHSEEVLIRAAEPVQSKEVFKEQKGASNGLEEAPKITDASKVPLKLNGILDQFKSFDVTPVIGKEFPDASLAEWLRAPNSDALIRDLAITGLKSLNRF